MTIGITFEISNYTVVAIRETWGIIDHTDSTLERLFANFFILHDFYFIFLRLKFFSSSFFPSLHRVSPLSCWVFESTVATVTLAACDLTPHSKVFHTGIPFFISLASHTLVHHLRLDGLGLSVTITYTKSTFDILTAHNFPSWYPGDWHIEHF